MKAARTCITAAVLVLSLLICSTRSDAGTAQEDSIRTQVIELMDQARELMYRFDKAGIDSAYTLFKLGAEIARTELGHYDSLHAWILYRLGENRIYADDIAAAISHAEKMQVIVDSVFSDDLTLNVYCLALLGDSYVAASDYARAIPFYQRQIAPLQDSTVELDATTAMWLVHGLNDLARTWKVMGEDSSLVKRTYEAALDLTERKLGRDHSMYGNLLANMAWAYYTWGDYAEAERRFKEALPMINKTTPPQRAQSVANSVFLANCVMLRGGFAEADSILQRQLKIIDSTHGDKHPRLCYVYNSQASLLAALDSLDRALEVAERAVEASRQDTRFPTHAEMGLVSNQGRIAFAAGRNDLAAEIVSRLSSQRISYLMNIFRYASEPQKLNFVRLYSPIQSHLLAGVIQSGNEHAVDAGINMVLRGKGLAVDAMAAEQTAAVCSDDPILHDLLRRHRLISEQIAASIFSAGSGGKDILLDSLFSIKDNLETDISLQCSNLNFFVSLDSVTGSRVADSLTPGSVLLDYIKFEDYDYAKICMNLEYDTSYGVITIDNSGRQSIVGLGGASAIDSLIDTYRSLISAGSRDELARIGNELYQRMLGPVEDALTGADRVYVSADGAINLLPFETLIDDDGRFLIENHEFVYLSSGRDLLRQKNGATSNQAIVIADPDFMSESRGIPSLAFATVPSGPAFRGSPECLASMFSPLPMTQTEGIAITNSLAKAGFSNVGFYSGPKASEAELKSMSRPPSILHIATHGYFCGQAPSASFENPLLRSGLILAGANRTIAEVGDGESYGDDGILTALEVSGLNLIGTDLVVLSACQTGVGDVMNGEGVFGLRRAFQHAGAESIIMSLFDVPEDATMTLMTSFYKNWLSGNSKAAALRRAAMDILQQRRETDQSTHPAYWGGFILVGDPD